MGRGPATRRSPTCPPPGLASGGAPDLFAMGGPTRGI
ncbi:hypothetical protein D4764_0018190 [Takifugu flavidus]|uniref:Uncharacterized protein n=1 Tax=Takifugu flavidus TaxID=433684 RepID=A0A5C6MDM8_9TELE|nr:hypothetical protein D4764_0018190 [Takifugu flavidus]